MKTKNKKAAILGFGIEGKDAAKYLLGQGWEVVVFDQKEERELDFSGIDKKRLIITSGPNYLKSGLNNFDVIIRSPGFYRFLPILIEAEKNGVEISSALKIFFDLCPAKIIGVTGTKGKGTTSTLIYEILKMSGKDVYLAGNIGKPYLELLDKVKKDSFVVMELSSFQLIDLTQSPHIAVVLNVTVDHLDWHKNEEEYVEAKKNILSHQTSNDFAVINSEYKSSKNFAEVAGGKVVYFSKRQLDNKFKEKLLLRGEHNLENIAAAVTVARTIGIDDKTIIKVVQSFKGLEHRLELVGEVEGRIFYNDSFATNPQPVMAAVKSFSEPITLILGGSDKGLNYDELGKFLKSRKNVKTLILIGQISEVIKKSFTKCRFQNTIVDLGMTTMQKIIEVAIKNTPKGGVVLLSPGSASFGMFKNYKERGNQFKKEVLTLS